MKIWRGSSNIVDDVVQYWIVSNSFCEEQQEGVDYMGKNLKGKELGIGISQRKDGLYTARFTDKLGNRRQKYFKKLQECRQWMADAQFQDEHGNISAFDDMTVSAWFEYWIDNFKAGNVKTKTLQNYKERFKYNIAECIGNMLLSDVRPLHCQNVLNHMSESGYCTSTIELTRITMYSLFEYAAENELLVKNPVSKNVKCIGGKEPKAERVLTVDEQRTFLNATKGKSNYNQYAFVLQTGLRAGELAALKWTDIDFEKGIIHITRTVDYRTATGEWETRSPKSKSGLRDIPLSDEAICILNNQRQKMQSLNIIPMEYHDFVFLSKNGNLIRNSAYNKDLQMICKRTGLAHFSMHTLRHTFATRCAEAGMQPKTLQSILGHSNISVTMDIYVHCTEDKKTQEMKSVASMLKVI